MKNYISLFLTLMVGFGAMTAYLFFFGPERVIVRAEKILSDEFEVEIDIPAPIIKREEVVVEPKSIEVTFIGDMMFDRYIRLKATERGSYDEVLEELKEQLNSYDLVVGNLEGPVTTYPTKTFSDVFIDQLTFTFDTDVPRVLNEANIKVVSLDNNHIFNFGRNGVRQTKGFLEQNEIEWFGDPDDRQLLIKEVEGIKFGFVSYNYFHPDESKTLELIDEAKDLVDWVVVFAHWGDEYEHIPNTKQMQSARNFIDQGSDIVIGAHPHVIQRKELYKDKWIYYSLGNFVFDQYFQEDVRCGAMVTFEVTKDEIKDIEENFTYLNIKGKTIPSDCAKEVLMLEI
jgi:poly-gamma-glutamate synthesis protein (capsule biosynthesis protein)